ncbi:MAG: hypothetical protein DRO11_06415 [Methanobacteriota archaeon]|nr:MAG: hypothetical protein DRO11_06415 [Euryarchaeota archaeon]
MRGKKIGTCSTLVLLLLTCFHAYPTRSEACALIVSQEDVVGDVISKVLTEKTGYPTIKTGITLDNSVKARLQILGVEKVFVLGGPEKVSGNVENELRNMGLEVERVAGATPSLTSIAIVKRFWGTATTLVITDSTDTTRLDQGLRVALRGDNPKPIVVVDNDNPTPDLVTGLEELQVSEIELVAPYTLMKHGLESAGFEVIPVYKDLDRYLGEPSPELLIGPTTVEHPRAPEGQGSANPTIEETRDPLLRRIEALENDETLSHDLRGQLRKAKELFQKYRDMMERGDVEAAKNFLEECENILHRVEEQRTKKFVVIGKQVRNV